MLLAIQGVMPRLPLRALLTATAACGLTVLSAGADAAPTVPNGVLYRKPDPNARVAAGSRRTTNIIYLNRCEGGCTVSPGKNNSIANTTEIALRTGTLTEFAGGDDLWQAAVDCARDVYAPYNVVLTEEDPGDVPHFEVMIAGVADEVGRAPVGGLGVGACGEVVDNSISMVFANTPGANDATWLCYAIAQETAHNFGLDHELEASDPMSYLPFDGVRQFMDAEVPCGEMEATDCCAGPSTQNSHAYLMDEFGPSDGSPTESIRSADDHGNVDAVGCATGGSAGGLAVLAVGLALAARRRR